MHDNGIKVGEAVVAPQCGNEPSCAEEDQIELGHLQKPDNDGDNSCGKEEEGQAAHSAESCRGTLTPSSPKAVTV